MWVLPVDDAQVNNALGGAAPRRKLRFVAALDEADAPELAGQQRIEARHEPFGRYMTVTLPLHELPASSAPRHVTSSTRASFGLVLYSPAATALRVGVVTNQRTPRGEPRATVASRLSRGMR